MMWNWFKQLFQRQKKAKRKKVHIDMQYEHLDINPIIHPRKSKAKGRKPTANEP